jgi:hypothetical protein
VTKKGGVEVEVKAMALLADMVVVVSAERNTALLAVMVVVVVSVERNMEDHRKAASVVQR